MRTVICVPRWADGGRRDELWAFTRKWIEQYYPYPIFEGYHEGPGEARDAAAKAAGDWDVAIMHDADTLAHREAIELAVENAATTGDMTLACDSHMYLSEASTNRLLAGDPQFMPRPYSLDRRHECTIYARPCSGVYAIPRSLYDAIGGFPHAGVWGNEDQIWFQLARIFADHPTWTPEHITLHLFHPVADRSSRAAISHPEHRRNLQVWKRLFKMRSPDSKPWARQLLADTLDHQIP